MPKYSFEISKVGDHGNEGVSDVHVHVYFNEGKSRKLLGRYRLPGLDPIFSTKEPQLNNAEEEAIREFLADPRNLKKIQDMAALTVFDLGKVGAKMQAFAEVGAIEEDGETYLVIKIPVAKRIT